MGDGNALAVKVFAQADVELRKATQLELGHALLLSAVADGTVRVRRRSLAVSVHGCRFVGGKGGWQGWVGAEEDQGEKASTLMKGRGCEVTEGAVA